ncbi:MAG: NAD(P)H-binding protein [Nonomuraea sp.]|nr:NAD(P)H-binding protein [Nonomuraea sp.]
MIVITTPTGRIGSKVLDLLLDSGEPIRVVARDPARVAARDRVEVVQGSLADLDVVTKALSGADAVLWVLPPDPRSHSLAGHAMDFTRPLVEAVVTEEVGRVVSVSTLGRGVARNAGQITTSLAADDLVASTGVPFRALAMPGFMENLLNQVEPIRSAGVFFTPIPTDLALPTCATRDIAAVAARLLLDDSWTGRDDVPVLGPEDLSPDDQAAIMSEVLGRPVRCERVSLEDHRATLVRHGLHPAWAQGLADMAREVMDGLYHARPRTPEGTTPTTFRQWCAEELRPAVLG